MGKREAGWERGKRGGQSRAPAYQHPSLLLLLCPYFQLPRDLGRGTRGQGPCGRCCCPPGPFPPGNRVPVSPVPTSPPLPAAGVKPGRLLLEEHGLPLPWRNTNTHQRSLEIHARSPGREKRGGNGGGSRGHGPQARQTGTEPSSSAGSQQPPSPRLHPQPQQTALAPPEYRGPLRAQHPIWVQAAHQPQPRQNRAVPMGLRATQGTEGSRNVPAPLAASLRTPRARCSRLRANT